MPRLEGYELLEKLGAGGYGEVWSAIVPGGMKKAVKCIFGRQDESRAASELKALERIREVRHPFVVSLERVEFIGGRVVVVSELADASLRDRFRQCVAKGLSGIPREELLGYLQDTADALDYISQTHGLQHLDIKPENILLLSGHAKVADFGLVKTIGDKTQSLVGGMTPAYAPPEIFQGSPARQSDQYSLAVLFQEMLTGRPPFSGENAAQLTLQHLHDDPDLSPLSDQDHFAVARALSKDPEHRYESCLEFVRALRGIGGFGAEQTPASTAAWKAPDRNQHDKVTEVFEDETVSNPATPMRVSLPPLAEGPVNQPPPAVQQGDFQPTPCLFVGMGGVAATVLRGVRQRITDQYELSGPLPTMRMLLMDTDPRSLTAATRNAGKGGGLMPEETIALPLRRPQEYRDKTEGLLRWLGRRWLYNIPKSLRTEGIRPLGRLALMDHARQSVQRLRRAVAECIAEESLEAAQEATGVAFRRDAVRIYVVASPCGGTGSGMSLDVAYMLRTLVKKHGVTDARIIGVAPTLTGRSSERGELARVNAFSWIAEHQHYCTPGVAYQGDASSGLPGHDAGVPPFDSSYVVHMGDRLGDEAFEQAAGEVAEYLASDAVSPLQTMLDASRVAAANHESQPALRTFAINRLAGAEDALNENVQQIVINQLVELWHGGATTAGAQPSMSTTNRIVHGAGELVGRLKLDAVSVANACRGLVEAAAPPLPMPPAELTGPLERLDAINQQFVRAAGAGEPLLGGETPTSIAGRPVRDIVDPLAKELAGRLERWASAGLDQPGMRLAGALRAIAWLRDHADGLAQEFTRFAATTHQKLAAVIQQAAASEVPSAEIEARYHRLKVDLVALEGSAVVAATLGGALQSVAEKLTTLRPMLATLLQSLRSADPCSLEGVAEHLASCDSSVAKLMQALDARLQRDWIDERGGLASVLQTPAHREELTHAIRRLAEQVINESVRCRVAAGEPEAVTVEDWKLPLLAGHARTLQYAVGAANPSQTPAPRGTDPWRYQPRDAAKYLVVEGSGLSAPHAAVSLIGGRRDYADFAARVHTRRDLAWLDLLTTAAIPNPDLAQPTCTVQLDINPPADSSASATA